jgi:hypothetical protein
MTAQRTDEWFSQRLGKFTGSQIYRLMASGRRGEMFGIGAMTYIKEKAAEIITDGKSQENKQVDNWATKWGVKYEPIAKRIYEEYTFDKVHECGFILYDENFGASPDGLIGQQGVLEIKCPYTTEKHIEYILCKDQYDLLQVAPEYYYQMQAEMICTGRIWAHFVSYDPNCDERTCFKLIQVLYDVPVCNEILDRVSSAAVILKEMLTEIRGL